MTNWTFAIALWGACLYAAGCETPDPDPVTATMDAGPVPCKEGKILCAYEDTDAGDQVWTCGWVWFCDQDGGVE